MRSGCNCDPDSAWTSECVSVVGEWDDFPLFHLSGSVLSIGIQPVGCPHSEHTSMSDSSTSDGKIPSL